VVQSIDMGGARLVSDVIVKASVGIPLISIAPIFAGYGSVITAGRAAAVDGTRLAVTVEAGAYTPPLFGSTQALSIAPGLRSQVV
jgi:hypothetical protein